MTIRSLIPDGIRFNQRVSIYRYTEGARDAMNAPAKSETLVATVWAAVRSDTATNLWKSAEREKADQMMTAKPVDVVLRYSDQLSAIDDTYFVRYGSEDYNIVYVDNINQKNRFIWLLCEVGTGST